MRIFLADFGDLIGPLLLIAFAVLPRFFKSKKKKISSTRPRPQQVSPPPAARPAPAMEMEAPPEPELDIPELAELGEVLQELLGQKRPEPSPPPLPEPEFVESSEPQPRDYYEEPAEAAYVSDFKQRPEEPWETHHLLASDRLTSPAQVQRRNKHRNLFTNRSSLKDLMVLREILGPPRSLQPIEDWDSGGS